MVLEKCKNEKLEKLQKRRRGKGAVKWLKKRRFNAEERKKKTGSTKENAGCNW